MRRTDTKIRIEAAAIELFGRKGYDATSMRDIAAIVGITEPGLYRHFTGKEELGRHVFVSRYAALARQLRNAADRQDEMRGKIGGMVDILLKVYHETPLLFRFLLLSQHQFLRDVSEDEGNVAQVVSTVLAEAAKEEKSDLISSDPNVLASIVMGIAIHSAVFNIYQRLPGDLGEHRDTLVEAACRGIGL
ncbi:MAG: TetR/AcrR family transcriptional regulator [Alphaproteobacteria bacterium]